MTCHLTCLPACLPAFPLACFVPCRWRYGYTPRFDEAAALYGLHAGLGVRS